MYGLFYDKVVPQREKENISGRKLQSFHFSLVYDYIVMGSLWKQFNIGCSHLGYSSVVRILSNTLIYICMYPDSEIVLLHGGESLPALVVARLTAENGIPGRSFYPSAPGGASVMTTANSVYMFANETAVTIGRLSQGIFLTYKDSLHLLF